jgi:BirA family biotin operon repressor/biotin-[acetyl-CoA-carboxylase] ligase
MDEKILKILRVHRDSFISAEEIAQRLSFSKSTVVKYIHNLRDEGYDIQARPHLGYKLLALPDRLLPQELAWRLNTKIIGQKILSYNTVDSTNTVAFSLAERGLGEGTAVFAEAQKKGKGRLGRSWVSAKGKGIYLSVILRPGIALKEAAFITLLAAVSCAESIRKISGQVAEIRWPNDILVNNKKVCGILTEMQAENSAVKFVILGIGINVNTSVDKLPAGGGSLREGSGKGKEKLSRLKLARELLRHLDKKYLYFKHKGRAGIIREWKNLSAFCGKRIKVSFAHKSVEGQAQGVDAQGALILRLDNGFKQHILAGDVIRVR